MNQFKSSWQYTFANWKFFLLLALPVIAIESLTGYLIMPLGDMTQPEDFIEFFESNSLIIALVGIVGLILQISFIGGLWIGFVSIDGGKIINPMSALQAGFSKFFPIKMYIFFVLDALFLINPHSAVKLENLLGAKFAISFKYKR